MQRRLEPSRHNLLLFNLRMNEFRTIELTLMHPQKGVSIGDVVNMYGDWNGVEDRGLVAEREGRLFSTSIGKAYHSALEAYEPPYDA